MTRRARRRSPVATEMDVLYAEIPDVGCRGLCSDSCGSVGMTPVEQKRIADHGVVLPLVAAFQGSCPALVGGRCSVYQVRPTICRLWGAVEGMPCPHGCRPAGGRITDAEGLRILDRATIIDRRAAQ